VASLGDIKMTATPVATQTSAAAFEKFGPN
jgi:hypothetical protein